MKPATHADEATPAQRAALDGLCAEHGGRLEVSYLRTKGDGVLVVAEGADGWSGAIRETGEVF